VTAFIAALAAAALVLGWIVGAPLLKRRRRAGLLASPLPEAARAMLARTRAYRRLPPALRPRLIERVRVFLAEREFVGCGGLAITDAIRAEIASQACLLILNRSEHVFDELRSILVYPDEFVVRDAVEEHGVVTARERTLAGQSWDTARIILSWRDVRDAGDGYNVVIHEFAHYLDEEEGAANGAPLLYGPRDYARWADVMQRAYDELAARADAGEDTLLDPYGVEDEAEFFAVASETFFELPRELRAEHPELYAELAGYYRLDPALW
jgi:Mlc titration factor MtfA (ptsG expression regulator)